MRILLAAIISFAYLSLFSQNNNSENEIGRLLNVEETTSVSKLEKGYIITKKNEYKACFIHVGNENNNWEFVDYQKFKTTKPARLTKDDISGYGYEDVYYELMPYKEDSVFMLKINNKEPFLYYYKTKDEKKFFFKKGEEFKLLPENKQDLITTLKEEYIECDFILDQIKYVSHNKTRLSNILLLNEKCINKKLSYFKYGIGTSYLLTDLKLYSSAITSFNPGGLVVFMNEMSFEKQSGFNLNFFMDVPFIENNFYWTIHPEIEYIKAKYTYSGVVQVDDFLFPELIGENLDLQINYFNINVFFRYNSLRKKASFYTDFGPILSLNSSKSTINQTEIELNLNNFMIGFGLGLGVDYPIFKTSSINVGLKANYLFPAGGEELEKFKVWNLGVAAGFAF
jgi:hypothetical protein